MKFHVVVLLCIFASIYLVPWINGFNVETKHCTIFTEEKYSMFGFSVAEHLDRNLGGWVIVGAPEAQTYQPGVTRGGAVYRCDIHVDNSCTPINFDSNGNSYNTNPKAPGEVDNKTMQWFGATVSTSQVPDGPILACAPRYMWYSANFVRREPVGTCYITQRSFTGPKEFSPCRTKHWGYHRQGSCQAGLGAALSENGQRVIIGAPGSFYWQGQTFSASTDNLPRVLMTHEGRARDDDSYLGYSVTTGDFEGNGEIGTAVGMPRGNDLLGQVLIFSQNLTNYQKNLTADQMGAYFGYSVASCDINGDGLVDLIVGAPMYTIDNPGETFETGRVHIFYQENGVERFTRTETRIGFKTRSRFGLSLASLKDIDRDGFEDFAVGAPYDGPEGRGAVYIYHGSKDGCLETYSQVIYAEDVSSTISTFGFSVAGGHDLDGNEYPDTVVGAYESSTAAFFRSRPVIKMESWVAFDAPLKSISLENKDCEVYGGVKVTCLLLNTCLTYTGLGVESQYLFNVEYALDTKKSKNRRLFFIDHEKDNSINQTIRLTKDEELCKSFKVFVDQNITDKLTSIDAEMRMSVVETIAGAGDFRNPRAVLTPVLGTTKSRPDTLSIFKSCGSDNICIPNLILNVTSKITAYLLASGDRLEIDVTVNNTGEHAYEALFYLEKPPGIEYINIVRKDKTGIPIQCSAPSSTNNYTLMCDIGNPLPKNESVFFTVILQPIKIDGLKAYYDLQMGVNSTNPELDGTQDDNKVNFRMPIWIQTELVIEGVSKPKEIYYNAENYTAENITNDLEFGPVLTHNYTIRNDGPSAIIQAEAWLIWPARTLSGEELLYLLEQPETVGMTCETANADYLSLRRDRGPKYQPIDGSYGHTKSDDRINQLAEQDRINQGQEQQSFGNGTRDYNYDVDDFVISSDGARNMSTSHSSNYTSAGGGYGTEHHTYYESHRNGQLGHGNQQGVTVGGRLQQQQQSYEEERRLRYESEQKEAASRVAQQQREDEERRLRLENEQKEVAWRAQQQKEDEERRLRIENAQREASRRAEMQRQEDERRLRIENDQREASRRAELQRQEEERRLRVESEQREVTWRSEQQRQDEERRLRWESEQREATKRREEEERIRIETERRNEEERRRTEAIAREHLSGNQQWQVERHETYDRSEAPETYGVQKHYVTDNENSQRQHTGYGFTSGGVAREENHQNTGSSGLNINLSNIGSSKDLEKFFSTLNHEAAAITTYTREGKEYVQFDGRFRSSAGKDYIQFKNGQRFEVLDSYGAPSYSNGQGQSERYLSMEGQLVGGDDGNIYIQLKDGRKFRIPGTYTYQRKQTFTVGGGGPHESEATRTYTYGKQITHEGSSGDGRVYEPVNTNNYREESYKQEFHSGKKIFSGINSGAGFDSAGETLNVGSFPTGRPDDRLNRYARESDVLNVEQFRKFEKNQRHRRDANEIDIDFDEVQSFDALPNARRYRREEGEDSNADVVGKGQVTSCKSAECVRLECKFGPLKKGEEVSIKVRYRVKAKTLNTIAANEKVKVSTQLTAKVTRKEFLAETPDEQLTKSHEITTVIHPSAAPDAPDVVPLWVVVLSACAGTIILLLLIFLLYKIGFFKRNRPNSAPERQPLNRNGHYSNDD